MLNKKPILSKIKEVILNNKNFLITASERYDGDAIGSELALYFALKKLRKNPEIVNSKKTPKEYLFLGDTSKIIVGYEKLKEYYDVVIAVDSGNFEEIDLIKAHIKDGGHIINIDHHQVNTPFGSINWVEPDYSATGELIYELIKFLNIPLDKRIAEALYLAISTDSGRFSYASVTSQTHSIAADLLKYNVDVAKFYENLYESKTLEELKLKKLCIGRLHLYHAQKIGVVSLDKSIFKRLNYLPDDFQEYIEIIKSLRSVKIALLLREEDRKVRVSIRTSNGIDASKLAEKFSGGGHKRAAGCSLSLPISEAEKALVSEAKKLLLKYTRNHKVSHNK